MNSNSFVRVRVQKKYFFEIKFEFGKMIEFFRVRSPGLTLLDKIKSADIRESLNIESLLLRQER